MSGRNIKKKPEEMMYIKQINGKKIPELEKQSFSKRIL
jgi:hypothetical protein